MNKVLSVLTNDSNLGVRLVLSFGLLISIVVCLGLVGLKHVRADAELEEVIDARWYKVQLSRDALAVSNLNNRITMQVFLIEDENEINSLLLQRAQNSEKISTLIETLRSKVESSEETQLLDAIEKNRTPYLESYQRALHLLVVDKKSVEARAVMVQEALPRLLKYHGAWNAYVEYQGNQLNQAQSTTSASHFTSRIEAFLLISLTIVLAFAIAFFVTRNLMRHMARRKRAEEALRQAHDELEMKVQERTTELAQVNEVLKADNLERKRAEKALHESQQWLTAIFDSSRDGIIVEESEHIVYVNQSYARLFGYEADELMGQPVWLVSEQEPSERMLEYSRKRLRGEEAPSLYEFQGTRKDGTNVDLEASVSTAKIGAKTCIISLCRDITERKRMEDERRIISEIIQGAITTSDLDNFFKLVHHSIGKCLYAENCFVALYDEATELMHFPFWVDKLDPCPPPRPVGIGFSSYVLRTGKPMLVDRELTEEMYRRGEIVKSGSTSASWLGVPLRTPTRTIGVLVVQHYEEENAYDERDLEFLTSVGNQIALAIERKRAEMNLRETENQLRQSQKMESIGTLAGGIAHDFNNLMTAVTGYSELVLRHLETGDPLRPKIEEIKKAGERAAALTRQLLAFSRKQILKPRVFDLNLVITGMGKMLTRVIGEDFDLKIELDASLGQVEADPGQVEQILLNLAVNARDAMPGGGYLTIKTENVYFDAKFSQRRSVVEPGHYVMLSVSDNGCGMDAETQTHIFEPFFTTKEIGKGTGLGLSTVYGIVKQSGGSIWVYSEVGRGTTFKIYLPRVDDVVEPEESADESRSASRGSETILLVEDEEMVRDLSKEILEEYGYAVITAPDGKEGLRICKEFEGHIDLMITDVVMPQMSGRQLAENVGALRPDTRVLYMSGFTDDAIVRHGVLDDGVCFIQKPFSPDSLAIKTREVLDQNGSR